MWWQILPAAGLTGLFIYTLPSYWVPAMNWVDTGRFNRRDHTDNWKAIPAARDEVMFGNYWVKSSLDLLPDAPKGEKAE